MARWITGIILAIVAVWGVLYVPPVYIKAVVVLLGVIGAWEFLNIAIESDNKSKWLGSVLAFLGLVLFLYCPDTQALFVFVYIVLVSGFILQFSGTLPNEVKIKNSVFLIAAIFYAVFLFGLFGRLTEQPHYHFWVFLVVACTYMADTGAYIVGRQFGKNKLAKNLSPGKTVEGAVGAVFGAMLAACVVRYLFTADLNLFLTLFLGLAMAVLGIVGDLSESLLKRGFGVKDSGHLIPGHGGVLDRFDSLLFTGPFVYFISIYA